MTPKEACLYLEVRNTFMVPVGILVDHRQYNKSFKTLSRVGWECFYVIRKPELLERNIEEAKEFKNIDRVVFLFSHKRFHSKPKPHIEAFLVDIQFFLHYNYTCIKFVVLEEK